MVKMLRRSRQGGGVFRALRRREIGCSLVNDRNLLQAHVEDATVSSCTKEEQCNLPSSTRSTFLVCFSPDRSKMASTHGDHTIRILDSYTGKCLRTLTGHTRTPWCIAFHPSANDLVASGCLAGEVRIWDLLGGCEVYVPPERAVIASLAFHPTDRVLLFATSNKLFLWQWDQPAPFACLSTNYLEEKVRLVKFSPLGDFILTGITNVTQSKENGAAIRNSTQTPVSHLLQSVSCTQLDSDQVSQYIVRPMYSSQSQTHTATFSQSRVPTSSSVSQAVPSSNQSRVATSSAVSQAAPSSNQSRVATSSAVSQSVPLISQSRVATSSTFSQAVPPASQSRAATSSTFSQAVPLASQSRVATSSAVSQAVPSISQSRVTTSSAVSQAVPLISQSRVATSSTFSQAVPPASQSRAATSSTFSQAVPLASQSRVATSSAVSQAVPSISQSRVTTSSAVSQAVPLISQSRVATSSAVSQAMPSISQSRVATSSAVSQAVPSTSQFRVATPVTSDELESRSYASSIQSQDATTANFSQSDEGTTSGVYFPGNVSSSVSRASRVDAFASASARNQTATTSVGTNQSSVSYLAGDNTREQPAAINPMHSNLQTVLAFDGDRYSEPASSTRIGESDGSRPEQQQASCSAPSGGASRTTSRSRNSRDYRGVFAIFRARGGGSWNLDTSELEGEPTDVGRSSLVFNQTGNTTDSMSFSSIDGTSSSNASSGDVVENSNPETQDDPMEMEPQAVLVSSESAGNSDRNVSLSSVTTSSELIPHFETLPPNTEEEFAQGPVQTSQVVYDPQIRDETSISTTGHVTRVTTNPLHTASEELQSGGQHSEWNRASGSHSNRTSDVTVSMDTVGLEEGLTEEASGHNSNGDRLISGVGSVFNVGAVSSRTSYVSHGSNYSSSLSTLSSQQGSGTAIATATARTFRHVHTAVVVANGTNGGPQVALRTAINRAIAGAFAGSGEGAVASNIINTTHRLQWWDFTKLNMPNIKDSNTNILVPCCKIHNDASCDISSDGTLLATFVPSAFGFPDDGMLGIYSLEKSNLGQCLFSKKFGPNAISVNLSSLNRYVVVGLAARRIHWHLTSRQMMAQVFKLESDKPSEDGKPIELPQPACNIVYCEKENERRTHVSVNAAFWHPVVGCGLVYGTNRGDLRIVRGRSRVSAKQKPAVSTGVQV